MTSTYLTQWLLSVYHFVACLCYSVTRKPWSAIVILSECYLKYCALTTRMHTHKISTALSLSLYFRMSNISEDGAPEWAMMQISCHPQAELWASLEA